MNPVALLSVSDKTGVVELARTLVESYGFRIISSGGTAAVLKAAQVPVTKVSDYTEAPEILGGRVKTLHPRVHGGILARLGSASDLQDLQAQGIEPIAVVVVNLYPFTQTIAQTGVTLPEAIEQIDIGGPAMIRAAAKNFEYVNVLSSASQYADFLAEMGNYGGKTSLEFRRSLAVTAFQHTQAYDHAISEYLAGNAGFSLTGHHAQPLRYGENPHQPATWYQLGSHKRGWSEARQFQGKELSYNNLLDLEAARAVVGEFIDDQPCAVIIKHNNPCGVAIASSISDAYERAFNADQVSAFGGIVALNRTVDSLTAQALTRNFLECVVAPAYDGEALAILQTKPNLRVLALGDLGYGERQIVKVIAGGLLVQGADDLPVDPGAWQIVSGCQPTAADLAEMIFAWKVCRHVKSNAIVITSDRTTVGVGAGQMNRIGSAEIALAQAGDRSVGATLASDGFFPFDDTVRLAASRGIKCIVQPGGSLRDQESIQAANDLGIVMAITHTRHFLH